MDEVNRMDYSGYCEFPFPSKLTEEETKAKAFFMALEDQEQLNLLNGSGSYSIFLNRVMQRIQNG